MRHCYFDHATGETAICVGVRTEFRAEFMRMKAKLTDLRVHQLALLSQLLRRVVGGSSETGSIISASSPLA